MTSPDDPRLAVAPAEAAKLAGISRSEIYNQLASGHIKARKVGKRTLVELASLRDWLASLPAYGSKAA